MNMHINITNKLFLKFCLLVLLFFSAGCYSVTVISPEETKIERGIGVVKINMNPNADSFLVELKGVGLASTPMGTSIGFISQEFAVVTDSCKLILWVEKRQDLENLQELIGDSENICTLNKNHKINKGGI